MAVPTSEPLRPSPKLCCRSTWTRMRTRTSSTVPAHLGANPRVLHTDPTAFTPGQIFHTAPGQRPMVLTTQDRLSRPRSARLPPHAQPRRSFSNGWISEYQPWLVLEQRPMVLTLLHQACPDHNSEAHPMHCRRFNFPPPLRYERRILQPAEQHRSTSTGLEKGTRKGKRSCFACSIAKHPSDLCYIDDRPLVRTQFLSHNP
jgi:hypothetical protein